MDGYKFGSNVRYIDEDDNVIEGIVRDRLDYDDRIVLIIELDDGGFYEAKIRKLTKQG